MKPETLLIILSVLRNTHWLSRLGLNGIEVYESTFLFHQIIFWWWHCGLSLISMLSSCYGMHRETLDILDCLLNFCPLCSFLFCITAFFDMNSLFLLVVGTFIGRCWSFVGCDHFVIVLSKRDTATVWFLQPSKGFGQQSSVRMVG